MVPDGTPRPSSHAVRSARSRLPAMRPACVKETAAARCSPPGQAGNRSRLASPTTYTVAARHVTRRCSQASARSIRGCRPGSRPTSARRRRRLRQRPCPRGPRLSLHRPDRWRRQWPCPRGSRLSLHRPDRWRRQWPCPRGSRLSLHRPDRWRRQWPCPRGSRLSLHCPDRWLRRLRQKGPAP